jgi:hypothetical protein
MLMAMKTTRQRYHVYTHGQHNNHPAMRQKSEKFRYNTIHAGMYSKCIRNSDFTCYFFKEKQQPADRGHQQQQEMEENKAIKNEQEEEEDQDEGEEEDEGEVDEDETEKEDDKGDEMEGDDEQGDEVEEDDDDSEEQQQKQPPRKMTKKINGRIREYKFLKSVKSVDELDNFRFKVIQKKSKYRIKNEILHTQNYCAYGPARKSLPTFKSLILPCTRKRRHISGKQCDFELMALRQNKEEKTSTIHVYAHSEHNHPLMSEGM